MKSRIRNQKDVAAGRIYGVAGAAFSAGASRMLGFVRGPMMEENLRRALLLARGDFSRLVTRPLSA